MSFFKNIKRMLGLFLVFSLLIAICEIDHLFCKIDQISIFEIVHTAGHFCKNHHCCYSEENHALHAKHYNCCDSEEPHDHPVRVPISNADSFNSFNAITAITSISHILCKKELINNSSIELFSQCVEETYNQLLCNDTIVLII